MRLKIIVWILGMMCAFFLINTLAAEVPISATVLNILPVASNAILNGANDITLTANQTTEVNGTLIVTDLNGCDEIINVTANLFKSNISGGPFAPDDNRSHYSSICVSQGDCAGGVDTTESYTCLFNMTWYADPTDVGSLYENVEWSFDVYPTDGGGGINDVAVQEVLTLTALSVYNSTLSFGTLSFGQNTSAQNPNLTISNHGNEALDINLKGYGVVNGDGLSMGCDIGTIPVNNVEHNVVPFTYGSGQDLTAGDMEVDIDMDRGAENSTRPEQQLFFGLEMPAVVSGNCTGTIVITAVSDPTMD